MSVEALVPEAASEAAETTRSLAADFQEVFGTPQGQRVLAHIINKILLAGSVLSRNHVGEMARGEYSANDALYLGSRRDAAVELRYLLNMKFTDDPKPIVRRTPSRFSSHK